MARTTVAALQTLLGSSPQDVDGNTLSSADLGAFIDDASAVVTDRLGSAGLTTDLLTRIETYVAADFATTRVPQVVQDQIGTERRQYNRQASDSFLSSSFGRTARLIDSSGILEAAARQGGFAFAFKAGGR